MSSGTVTGFYDLDSGFIPEKVERTGIHCGRCYNSIPLGSEGYHGPALNIWLHTICAEETEACKNYNSLGTQNGFTDPEVYALSTGEVSPSSSPLSSPRSRYSDEGRPSHSFLYRHRYAIGALAVGLIAATAIGLEYIRKRTTEFHHEYCVVPNEDSNSLYCCVKNVFAEAASKTWERYSEYCTWKPAGEPALNYGELPPHQENPPQVLTTWTTNAIQRLWTRFFG